MPSGADRRERARLALEKMARDRPRPPRHVVDPPHAPRRHSPFGPANVPRSTMENTSRLSTTARRQRPASSAGTSLSSGSACASARTAISFGRLHQVARDPAVEIGERARDSARFLATVFAGPRSRLPSGPLFGTCGQRRKQAEIDVHRLERARAGVDGLDMAAGDVAEQRAMRGGRRRQRRASRRAARRRRSARPAARSRRIPHSPRSR